jgi:predicted nuclease of predicted toxin-antitoxin system
VIRFLADENFPLDAVSALRAAQHDVRWIRDSTPGIQDAEVLALAMTEHRILLTFDKDFGELAFHAGLPASCGVILFRASAPSAAELAQIVVHALASRDDWPGFFSVIDNRRIRMRALP